MTPDQLRKALNELNGERACSFIFAGVPEPSTQKIGRAHV